MSSTNDGSSPAATPPEQQPARKKLPVWTPFALIAGSTVALGLPLIFLYKRQRSVLQKLQGNAAPPPRRSVAVQASRLAAASPATRLSSANVTQAPQSTREDSDSDFAMPGVGELYGAISSAPKSSAMLGAKAFGIATCIVGISAVIVVIGVQQITGVQNAREFGLLMRHAIWTTFPGLTSIIHRRSEAAEELAGTSSGSLVNTMAEDWTLEDAEKRLEIAYEQGGITAWQQVALKELEIEAVIERERRKKQIDKIRRSPS
ncbi:hypothetical protein BDN72DRAFT_827196 [Pluteus cervinus]|uniref:Uncharacterized protein n=1 Tax=Pluteus cervinus TaxID=181527 RepID=A0ACD3ABI7_9AGAR|nr:hypothetical protein BDN72DRAFT_827196 [Pluteus cervinus]